MNPPVAAVVGEEPLRRADPDPQQIAEGNRVRHPRRVRIGVGKHVAIRVQHLRSLIPRDSAAFDVVHDNDLNNRSIPGIVMSRTGRHMWNVNFASLPEGQQTWAVPRIQLTVMGNDDV